MHCSGPVPLYFSFQLAPAEWCSRVVLGKFDCSQQLLLLQSRSAKDHPPEIQHTPCALGASGKYPCAVIEMLTGNELQYLPSCVSALLVGRCRLVVYSRRACLCGSGRHLCAQWSNCGPCPRGDTAHSIRCKHSCSGLQKDPATRELHAITGRMSGTLPTLGV